jgi:His/Glu/Gln/Arg/opine family amino acid ABC transporter permease subunit
MIEFTLWDIVRNLLLAARWTIALSLVAFIGGGLVGLALLVLRLSGGPWAERFVGAYVQLFQGTPLLMQLFLAYFGLSLLGVQTSAWVSASVALTLYTSAFLTEIWRGCVASIPRGPWEAAASLYAQDATMSRCFNLIVAGPYERGPEGPANSAHSYSVCRNRISESGALYRRILVSGASSRASAFSFIARSAST